MGIKNAKTAYDFGHLRVGGRHQCPQRSCGYLYSQQHIWIGCPGNLCFESRLDVHLRVYRPLAMLIIFHPPCASSFGFVDFLSSIDVTFSSPTLAGFTSLASVSFAPSGSGGLFDIETVFGNGDDFLWMFFGPQVFNSTPGEICLGPAGTFCTGSFSITPGPADLSGSLFADLTNPNAPTAGVLTGGSVSTPAVTTPEPSSLLLLGSGFLALGGIARRRLIARFN